MSMRLGRVLMRLHCMLVGGLMIALRMVLSCRMVSFCCVLVMLRCFFVRVVCHRSPCLKRPFCYSRETTRCPITCIYAALRSRANLAITIPSKLTIGGFEGLVTSFS